MRGINKVIGGLILSLLYFSFAISSASAVTSIGSEAPNFIAETVLGNQINFRSAIGSDIAVLEWYTPGCPFVGKYYVENAMQRLQKHYTEKGVKWFRIYSSGPNTPDYVDVDQAKALIKKRHVPASVINIIDSDGKIGHLYGAKVALYIVIIDEGRIVYAGGIDNHPSMSSADIPNAINYVSQALDELLSGMPVKQPRTKPYGCAIKYATKSDSE